MVRKIFSLLITLLLLMSCGAPATPPATPAAVNSPRPSATLQRAPTRGINAPSTSVPLGGSPVPAPSVSGKFAYAPGDGSIWVQDAASGNAKPIVTPSPDLFADAPAFSPDGNHLAYTESSLTAQGVAQNSIRVVDADGKNGHALATPTDVKIAYNWPIYSPDGKWVYYTMSYPVPPNTEHSEIQRVPVAGGAPQKLNEDARSAVLSTDGTRMAFLRFNFQQFSASLWVADANGQNPKQLVSDSDFSILAAPHFSPDGKWILFTASGPPTRQLPGAFALPRACEPQLLCLFAQPAYANGLPWDLWLVSADGARFQQLTRIGADSPWPSWSRDGKYIAFLDTSGIYLLDVNQRVIATISKNGGHGVFDWWQP